jgi:pimeloyl-ACP methyl ester carboxylesterase
VHRADVTEGGQAVKSRGRSLRALHPPRVRPYADRVRKPERGLLRATRAAAVAGLAAVALSAVSCGHGALLVDERTTMPYRALLEAADTLSAEPVALDASRPGEAPMPVAATLVHAIAGGETTDARPVFVLLNGVFSDARTWRFVVAPLAAHADVLLVDLPGTGNSSPRAPEGLDADAYAPRWLADRVYRALAKFVEIRPKSQDLILVGHSIAGTAVLRMLGDPTLRAEHAATRARIVGAALIAPGDVELRALLPTLDELAHLSAFEVGFARTFGMLEGRVEEATAASVLRPEARALRGEAERIVEALSDPDRRRASQAMLLRFRPETSDGAVDWDAAHAIAADNGRIDVPIALVWGREDDTLPLASGEKLAREIPGAQLVVVDDARHSVHQEQPLATSAALLRFAAKLGRHDRLRGDVGGADTTPR